MSQADVYDYAFNRVREGLEDLINLADDEQKERLQGIRQRLLWERSYWLPSACPDKTAPLTSTPSVARGFYGAIPDAEERAARLESGMQLSVFGR